MTIENANQMPRIFYCRHMQPGTAYYDGDGMYLVDTEAMKNLIGSVGKKTIPVYIGHQDVNLKDIQTEAAGFVSESFYNELDGWAWFKFIAVAESAFDAIKKGWGVSNAYMPTQLGGGGTKNNVPYKKEVIDGEFTHLAIVPDPRYEGACIMTPDEFKTYQENHKKKLNELKNSKEGKTIMFKMFKTERKEVTNSADANEFEINGKAVTLEQMVNALETDETNKTKKVVVNGKEMTVEEIQDAYAELDNAKNKMKKNKKMKKNMSSEDDERDGESEWKEEGDDEIGQDKENGDMDEEDCMSNSDDNEEEFDKRQKDIRAKNMKNKKKMKKNSKSDDDADGDANNEFILDDKHFNELRNAHLNATPTKVDKVNLSIDGLSRGKQKYGTKENTGRITH